MRAVILLLIFWTTAAVAHETSEATLRVVIVSEADGVTTVHVRLPAPLLFAQEAAARPSPSAPVEAPFIRSGGGHRLDREAIGAAPDAFAERVLRAVALSVDANAARPALTAFAVQHVAALPPFSTPTEAKAALAMAPPTADLHIASAYIDAQIAIDGVGDVVLRFPLDAMAFPGHVHLENVLIDARADPALTRVRLGSLTEPLQMPAP